MATAADQQTGASGERVRRVRLPASTALIDRYILRETTKPLLIALGVVLIALLMERILRLFDLLANHGGAFDLVIRMAANLVPHYLGLALPAAFFIAIFVVVARFGDDNELDALQATGLSVARFTRPFLWLAVGLTALSVLLFGFIQPYSRYAYRAIYHAVVYAAWDATVPPTTFVSAGDGITVTADAVDATGRRLDRVFVHQTVEGAEWATTAARGTLGMDAERTRIRLTLEDGVQVRTPPAGEPEVLRFGRLTLDRVFTLQPPAFRERGGNERELTLLELAGEIADPDRVLPEAQLRAELHARLARALTLPLLPLLAVPMGMAAKRARRGIGIGVAAVILVVYNQALQLGESLGDVGRIAPELGIWLPWILFAGLCLWLFHRAQVRPGDNPFAHAFERVESAVQGLGEKLKRYRPAKASPGAPDPARSTDKAGPP
ncbi:MAG: hypothetical protein RLY86_70 [Pseudomonadota bacterium]|jgi:lipopolysaccharide export system permease protein